jgi:hypothetical protein
VECADEVLARRRVDPGLAPNRGVDHREQRRGHVHDPHAAHPRRGDEAGEVGDGAAAEGHHDVAAAEADAPAHLPAIAGDRERLAVLGVRHLDPVRVDAGRGELGTDLLGDLAQRRLVDQQGGARAQPGDGRAQLLAHPAPDQDGIGVLGGDVDPRWGAHGARP